jgi:citronellol/citronellal dehydrogenase
MTTHQARSTVPALFDLTGCVAVVSCAGSGLGRTYASALAEAGACVVCAGRTLPGLEETVAERAGRGATALAVQADVSDEASVDALVAATVARFCRLDVMVNNAGVASVGPPESTTLADWQRVLDVNLTGVFLGARAAAGR